MDLQKSFLLVQGLWGLPRVLWMLCLPAEKFLLSAPCWEAETLLFPALVKQATVLQVFPPE